MTNTRPKRRAHRRYRRWTPREDNLLGSASDVEIGRRLGRTKGSVQQRRIALHIAGHDAPINRTPPRRWTAAEDRLLGTALDREVAQMLDRTRASVQARRMALGLPGYVWTRYRNRIEALAAEARNPIIARGP